MSNSIDEKRRYGAGRIIQGGLAIGGFGLFFMLVREVDFASVPTLSTLPLFLLLIAALTFINYSFDTFSWWLVAGERRPSFWTLMTIRARGEALTNLLPGGALIGEPMKVAMLMRGSSMSRAEAATAFLLGKFALILGHTGYVVTGLALSFGMIDAASERVFGTAHFAVIALAVAGGIFLLLITLLVILVKVRPASRWVPKGEGEGRWGRKWRSAVAELRTIEHLIADATRRHHLRMGLAILCGYIAWSLNAVEAFLIIRWLGIDIAFTHAYAIDGVSSVVRMILFVLPIGIGGQDWAITGLMMIAGVPDPVTTGARFVVLKRAREFAVIGIGLVLLALKVGEEARSEANRGVEKVEKV
jgi:glycosyltransferase 2 family protein